MLKLSVMIMVLNVIFSRRETEKVIEDFRNHTEEVHGIDYSKEAVMQFILRKQK